jgi:hypothetical protein
LAAKDPNHAAEIAMHSAAPATKNLTIPSYTIPRLREKTARLHRVIRSILRPSRKATPDDWARANRTYGPVAALPGPRDPGLTPYIIEPARQIANGEHKRIVVVCGAQMAKTETLLDVAVFSTATISQSCRG